MQFCAEVRLTEGIPKAGAEQESMREDVLDLGDLRDVPVEMQGGMVLQSAGSDSFAADRMVPARGMGDVHSYCSRFMDT